MGDVLTHPPDLIFLIAVCSHLFLTLHQMHRHICGEVAFIRTDCVGLLIQIENLAYCLVEKSPVVGDDQNTTFEHVEPTLKPFKHLDIQMIGRLVE